MTRDAGAGKRSGAAIAEESGHKMAPAGILIAGRWVRWCLAMKRADAAECADVAAAH
ncbi:MAG: hypothetical protein ACLUVV_00140 [Christensenellales bacterium]